jgi:hypothetical protein
VGRTSSTYERELKELLQGQPELLARYAKALDPVDRPKLLRLRDSPFLVIRAAGSLGFDLVALRSEFSFPIEVKASATDTIRFSSSSGRASEQLEAHRAAVDKVGLIVLYAYRRVGHRGGDPWRLYAAPAPERRGRLSLLRRRIPPIEWTKEGNGVLRWESGLPLVEFLDWLFLLMEPPLEAPA